MAPQNYIRQLASGPQYSNTQSNTLKHYALFIIVFGQVVLPYVSNINEM